jgi:hypothetical protein
MLLWRLVTMPGSVQYVSWAVSATAECHLLPQSGRWSGSVPIGLQFVANI